MKLVADKCREKGAVVETFDQDVADKVGMEDVIEEIERKNPIELV